MTKDLTIERFNRCHPSSRPTNYMQDPTTQQGFNRYAYCMYNPLKYVDPSGELYFGWNGNSSYDYEQAERLVLSIRYNQYLEIMQPTWDRINYFSNSLWSQGDSYGGAIGGNGCHGGGAMGGGSQTPYVDVHDNGDGIYIATARDIGNFAAGFIAAENGLSFTLTRILFDIYQGGIEPRVSRYAQNKGFLWGLRYFWPY